MKIPNRWPFVTLYYLKRKFFFLTKNHAPVIKLNINIEMVHHRFANTVGLVIEKRRDEGVHDMLQWYCENSACRNKLYEESFAVSVTNDFNSYSYGL
jgi:hypothetical protein